MTDTQALLADLRALAEEFARQERTYSQRNPTSYEEGARDAYDSAEAHLRDLIAKHTPEPDVSERDELARLIHHDGHRTYQLRPDHCNECNKAIRIANVVLDAGWRRR